MPSDNEPRIIASLEEARQALLALIEGMRRSLHVYTPYVDPRLYDDLQVLDTLRNRVVSRPRLQFYFLLPPAGEWRRECPRLLRLTERLSSAFDLRTPPREEFLDRPELGQGMIIADSARLLHLADPRRFVGSFTNRGSATARELLSFFEALWEKSLPDMELRQLRL